MYIIPITFKTHRTILFILLLQICATNRPTEIIQDNETLILDDSNSFISEIVNNNDIEIYESPYIRKIQKSYSIRFILGTDTYNDNLLDFFVEYSVNNYREISIYKVDTQVHMEIRSYKIDFVAEEDKASAKVEKLNRYIKKFELFINSCEYEYLNVIKNFFSGFLIVFKCQQENNVHLKFYYHLNKENDIFDYNTIIIDKFETKINDDLRNNYSTIFDDDNYARIYFDLFYMQKNPLNIKYEQVSLFITIGKTILIYTINDYDDYYPVLNKITMNMKSIFEDNIFMQHFCTCNSKYYLYKRLASAGYIIDHRIEDQEYLERSHGSDKSPKKDYERNVYIANCYNYLDTIIVYNCVRNINRDTIDITRREILSSKVNELSTQEYKMEYNEYFECDYRTFIELMDILVYICRHMDKLSVYYTYIKFTPSSFTLAFSLEVPGKVVIESDYINRVILVSSPRKLDIMQIFPSYIQVSTDNQQLNEVQMMSLIPDKVFTNEFKNFNPEYENINLFLSIMPQLSSQELIHMKHIQNFTFNFENKTNILLDDLVKGHFVDVSFDLENPTSRDTVSIKSEHNIKQYSFQFDMIKSFYGYSIIEKRDINTYADLRNTEFNFFIANDEQLVYLKNNRTSAIYEFNEQHYKSFFDKEYKDKDDNNKDKEVSETKLKQERDQYLVTRKQQELRDLISLCYCNIKRKTYFPLGITFQCIKHMNDEIILTDYYHCSLDKTSCRKLEELSGCDFIIYIKIMNVVLCKKKDKLLFYYFDNSTTALSALDVDIDKELEHDNFEEYDLYTSSNNFEYIVFYRNVKNSKSTSFEGRSAHNNDSEVDVIFARFTVTQKQQLKFITHMKLKFDHFVRYVFFETNRLIFITASDIFTYYWNMSLKEPILTKTNPLILQKYQITLLDKPIYSLYNNTLFPHVIGSTSFNNAILIMLCRINDKVGIVTFNINTSAMNSFENFLPLMEWLDYKDDEVIMKYYDLLLPHHKLSYKFFYRGVTILMRKKLSHIYRSGKKTNKRVSDSLYDYRLVIYFPQKKNIQLNFLDYKKQTNMQLTLNFKSQVDPSQNYTLNKTIKAQNSVSYQNILKYTGHPLKLRKINSGSPDYVYKVDFGSVIIGNILDEKMLLNYMADNFGNIVELIPTVFADNDIMFSSGMSKFLQNTDFDKISITKINNDKYVILTDKFAVLMDNEIVVKSFPLHNMFVMPLHYLSKQDMFDCTPRLLPLTDVILNICYIKNSPTKKFFVLPSFFNEYFKDSHKMIQKLKMLKKIQHSDIDIRSNCIALYYNDFNVNHSLYNDLIIVPYRIKEEENVTLSIDETIYIKKNVLFYDFVSVRRNKIDYLLSFALFDTRDSTLMINLWFGTSVGIKKIDFSLKNKSILSKILINYAQISFKVLFNKTSLQANIVFYIPGDLIILYMISIRYNENRTMRHKITIPKRKIVFFNNYFTGLDNVRLIDMKLIDNIYLVVAEVRGSSESLMSIYDIAFDKLRNPDHRRSKVFTLDGFASCKIDFDDFDPINAAIFPVTQKIFKKNRMLEFSMSHTNKFPDINYQKYSKQLLHFKIIFEDRIKYWAISKYKMIRIKNVPIRSNKAIFIVSNDHISEKINIDIDKYKQHLSPHMKVYANYYLTGLITVSLLIGFVYPLLKHKIGNK